jgi:GNAT superfamily N-acetyltransferase
MAISHDCSLQLLGPSNRQIINVPAVRMRRLAVYQNFKGKSLGAALLADVLRRTTAAKIVAYALVVDAKDESAAEFYAHHEFLPAAENTLFLHMPLATVKTWSSQMLSTTLHSFLF